MRWWDGTARIHVAVAAANALALAAMTGGVARWASLGFALAAAALIVCSLRSVTPRGELRLDRVPEREGGVVIGSGFEWGREEAQETVETGRAAARTEVELLLPDDILDRHILIVGTTGTGKTRLLELLILQAVARGDAVVVIDPKGDEGLLRRVRAAAGARFRFFSLPHPESSVRYNPLGRYRDVREVADRIAALLPSAGDALPFRNFGWEIVHEAASAIHGRKPMTLRNLKVAAIDRPVPALAGRPREHFLKTASALLPLFSKLSSPLLSPEEGGLSWEGVDRGREVAFLSLGSMLGYETASAVAKLALLDLQGYVGARYAYGKGPGPIWLFVDELGDVVTPEFSSILSKSRGMGMRVVGCVQTVADLEAALGSRARAGQVLGSANTVIQFRAPGAEDAEVFSRMAGERLVRMVSEGAAYEPALLSSGFKDVDDFRARFSESSDWREHALVPAWAVTELPVFHYFARVTGKILRGRVPLLR